MAASNGGPGQDWTWLYQKIHGGDESVKELTEFLRAGGRPNDMIVATLGNREAKAKPCPLSLEFLLKARADPNYVDPRVGSPLLHLAAWMSTAQVAAMLLDYQADIEVGEQGVNAPPLNTALAAGNAPVALLLLRRQADVQWKHEDGATALHVATAWIADDQRAQRRMPPLGDEPREIVWMLLHNGADPTQREGLKGLTPLDGFREGMRRSPWLQDEKIGPEFQRTSERIYALLSAADEAMKLKAKGNKAFGEGRYDAALEAWAEGRKALDREEIAGHHMAVLWSNEANACRKTGDLERAKQACENGLLLYCSKSVHTKLGHNLAECERELAEGGGGKARAPAPAAERPAAAAAAETPEKPKASAKEIAKEDEDEEDKEREKGAEKAAADKEKAKKAGTQLKGGFLKNIGESAKPMYGEAGSVQGKNHSDLVLAPVHGQMHKVPYGKIIPVSVPNPYLEKGDDSD